MRVHDERKRPMLHALRAALAKDALSFQDWFCLHLQSVLLTGASINHADELRHKVRVAEGDMVIGVHNDILVFSRAQDFRVYQDIQTDLTGMSPDTILRVYNLYHDRLHIDAVLALQAAEPDRQPRSIAGFGDTNALSHIFTCAQNQRRVRSPQYVLLVEDDDVTRRLVASLLKNDYALVTARDAQEAVDQYLLHAPDIMFLDINLPDRSGLDVLGQVMSCDPQAYVVMFSGNDSLDSITTSFTIGASGFVAKPFHKERMRSYVEESCAHHHKARA